MSYDERIEYETEILALEMRIERLKRLICVPSGNGGYTGDNYYPVGGSEASHDLLRSEPRSSHENGAPEGAPDAGGVAAPLDL
jgi:hypothetical protein